MTNSSPVRQKKEEVDEEEEENEEDEEEEKEEDEEEREDEEDEGPWGQRIFGGKLTFKTPNEQKGLGNWASQ